MAPQSRLSTLLAVIALFLLPAAAFAADSAVPQRSEIDDQHKWRVEDVFASDQAWENAFAGLQKAVGMFEPYRGRLGKSAAVLLECFAKKDSIELIADNLYVYAYLKLDEDNRVSKYQEMGGRIGQLWSKLSEGMAFIQPEIIAVGEKKIMTFVDATPALGPYRHTLRDLFRQQQHILSAKEEALLALAGPATSGAGDIFNMLDNADIDYGTVTDSAGSVIELSKERVYKLLDSPDRDLRRRVSNQYNGTYLKYQNTMAATLAASVKKDWFYAQARGYKTCLEASLDNYNIPVDVFHNLLKAVNENLAPLHKWTSLRKRILGVDTLYTYDLGDRKSVV